MEVIASHFFCVPFKETDQDVGMLGRFLVALGILVLLHSISSFLVPNLYSRGWRKTNNHVSPTIAFSSTPASWNDGKTVGSARSNQPVSAPRVSHKSESPPRHIILNDLRTGMQLDGVVVSSTPYAAFVNTGVVRVSKGGAFAPVNALLHHSDIPRSVVESLRASHPLEEQIGGKPLLAKRTPLTVFVKEVFKQAGRYTVTMDGTISKEDVVQKRQQVHDEGVERRRTRRLRRQLEDVPVGATTSGVVDKVIDEGVLVTITNLGSLNVTGLIMKKDLPRHLQVPEKLKPKFQNQLLEQDFVAGRPITCGVLEVHPDPSAALVYNVKLLFENFAAPLPEQEPVVDIFDSMTKKEQETWTKEQLGRASNDNDDDYADEEEGDEDEEGDEGDDEELIDDESFDEEVRSLYQELLEAHEGDSKSSRASKKVWPGAGSSKLLPVESIYSWEVIQDMLDRKELQRADVDRVLREVGVPASKGTLSYDQFREFVESIQQSIVENEEDEDEGEGGERDEGNESYDDDEGEEEDGLASAASAAASAKKAATATRKSYLEQELKAIRKAEEEGEMDVGDDDEEEVYSDDYSDEYGDEEREEGEEDEGEVTVYDDADEEEEEEEEEAEGEEEEEEGAYSDNVDDFGEEYGDEEEEQEEDDEGDYGEGGGEAYEDGDDESYDDDEVGEGEGEDREDDREEEGRAGEEGDDEYDDDHDGRDRDHDYDDEVHDEEEGQPSEATFEEVVGEIFEELKNDQDKVPVETFMAWQDVQEILDNGLVQRATLDLLVNEVLNNFEYSPAPVVSAKGKAKQGKALAAAPERALTLEQFSQLVRLLEEAVDAASSIENGSGESDATKDRIAELEQNIAQVTADAKTSKPAESNVRRGEEEEQQGEDEEKDAVDAEDAKMAFDELSRDGKVVTVEDFFAWEEIQDLLKEKILDKQALNTLVSTVGGDLTSPLDLEQFSDLLMLINDSVGDYEAADDDNDDEQQYTELDLSSTDAEEREFDEMDVAMKGLKPVKNAQQPAPVPASTSTYTKAQKPAVTNSAEKVAATMEEREVEDDDDYTDHEDQSRDDGNGNEEGEEEEEEEMSDEELDKLARQVFDELTPTGATTVPTKVFAAWPGVQEEIEDGMLTADEVAYTLKKVDPRNTGELTYEQFVDAMDMLEMKINERSEQMQEEEEDEEEEDEEGERGGGNESEDGEDEEEEEEDQKAMQVPVKFSPPAPAKTQKIAPASTPAAAKPTKAALPVASPQKLEVPTGAGVGFDAAAPKVKAKASAETDPADEMEELASMLYDELRGRDKTLSVAKFRAWDELQEAFKDDVLTPGDFEKALAVAGVSKTGSMSLTQFVSALDFIQNGVESKLAEDDDSFTDALGDDEEEEEVAAGDSTADKSKPKGAGGRKITDSSARVPSAAEVAVSLASGGAVKNDAYDFSPALGSLEALHNKQIGQRKPKSAKAVPVASTTAGAAAPSAQSVSASLPSASSFASYNAQEEDEEENEFGYSDKDYPESVPEMTEEEAAREIYDTLRNGRPSLMVGDFLRWDDVVELLDAGALTKEKLAAVLGEADVTVSQPDKTVLPFEKFLKAVVGVDKHIDFSKLDVPDLRSYDTHNMGIHNMDADAAATARQLELDDNSSDNRRGSPTTGPKFTEVADTDILDVRKPNKRAGKSKSKVAAIPATAASSVATPSSKVANNKEAKEVKGATEAPTAEVEVVSEEVPAPKRRASKKKAPVVVDAELSKDDLEIKEMFADLSKGKEFVSEDALRKWDDVQGLVQSNVFSKDTLDYFIKDLGAPAGRVKYEHFHRFVKSLDNAFFDKNGKILTPDEKHRAVNDWDPALGEMDYGVEGFEDEDLDA